VALHFQRKHKHVLDEINRITTMCPKSFTGQNFRPSKYTDATGRSLPCYLLTRDAFNLLAIGFTGRAAIQWKLRYIEAFNALDAAALENMSGQLIEARHRMLEIETIAEQAQRIARSEGARAALALSPATKARMKKALGYRERGFSHREISKVMDLHKRAVGGLLKTARELGLEA
jgi:Rha family phage regulatory protein